MGMHLMGVHLIGVYLIDVYLMNVPLSWASLAGLFRGHASASGPKPVSSSAPKACILCLRPRASGPCLCPYPCLRASALQAHTVYPGPLCLFSRAQPAEALQGWKRVDNYSLISRAAWIQL